MICRVKKKSIKKQQNNGKWFIVIGNVRFTYYCKFDCHKMCVLFTWCALLVCCGLCVCAPCLEIQFCVLFLINKLILS